MTEIPARDPAPRIGGADAPVNEAEPMSAWEGRYASAERLWSGRVNPLLTEVAGSMSPGRALDIGCGEGADLLHLAARGWEVVGIDYSSTAVSRFLDGAREIGAADRATGLVGDAGSARIEGRFDLVTIFFVHDAADETGAGLRGLIAAQAPRMKPGGRLLLAVHAVIPDGRRGPSRTYRLSELLSMVEGDSSTWVVESAEERWREVAPAEGMPAARGADALLVLRAPRG